MFKNHSVVHKIDKSFLINLLNHYIDGLVLNHLAGMLCPSPSGLFKKSLKASPHKALLLIEQALIEHKCELAKMTLAFDLAGYEFSHEESLIKARCENYNGGSSDWLLSATDQNALQADVAARIANRLSSTFLETPEIFNDLDIIETFYEKAISVAFACPEVYTSYANYLISSGSPEKQGKAHALLHKSHTDMPIGYLPQMANTILFLRKDIHKKILDEQEKFAESQVQTVKPK